MNWAAWVLVGYIALSLVLSYRRIAVGRTAMEPLAGGVAVFTTIFVTAWTAGLIWLVVLAATL